MGVDQPTVFDLFCGAGGLSEGFRTAGFQVVGGIDHDPDAIATYAHNFPEAEAICGDIAKRGVKRRVLDAAVGCDVLVGGPPCQGFSQVRNHTRLIEDARNQLYRYFVSVVRAVKPRFLVMENVVGLDQFPGVLEQIQEDLSLGGQYEVAYAKLDAANFGVPQTRERLIFFGVLRGTGLGPELPLGTGATDLFGLERYMTRSGRVRYRLVNTMPLIERATRLQDPDDPSIVSVEQAIGDLVGLRQGNREDSLPYSSLGSPASAYQRQMRNRASHDVTNVQVPRARPDTLLRLEAIPEGGNYRDLPDELQARYLTDDRWGQHNGTGKLARKHYYAYRRLHRAIWAWTLNTKADAAYHYRAHRSLSVREFARLQSFPDRFTFTTDPRKGALPGRIEGGAAHSRYRQVGNAVPPLLAQAVAESVFRSLLGSLDQSRELA